MLDGERCQPRRQCIGQRPKQRQHQPRAVWRDVLRQPHDDAVVIDGAKLVVVPFISSASACWIKYSVSVSTLEVESSNTRIFGSSSSVRAIEMRCFCPPDSVMPRSPTHVSYPSGSVSMKSWMRASFATCTTS